MLITADLHLNIYNGNKERFKVQLSYLDDLYYKAYLNSDNIIIAGDLFDTKDIIKTEVFIDTIKTFKRLSNKYENVHTYILSGNHDHTTLNSVERPAKSCIEILHGLDNIHIADIEDYLIVGNAVYYFVPYYESDIDFKTRIEHYKKINHLYGKDIKYLVCHQNSPIFPENPFIKPHFTFEDVEFFDHVFCGHIHRYKTMFNVTSINSPMYRDAGDTEGKNFLYVNNYTNEIMVMPTDYPEYRKVTLDSSEIISETIKNDEPTKTWDQLDYIDAFLEKINRPDLIKYF